MNEKKIILELDEKDAQLFILFRKYQDTWERVFEIKGGSATIHFDLQGNMRKAEFTDEIIY